MTRVFLLLSALGILTTLSFAQPTYKKYLVELKDKGQSRASIFSPVDYLSPAAIQRRLDARIPIDSTDLPVSESYIAQVAQYAHRVMAKSKWLNALGVFADSAGVEAIRRLPCVKSVKYLGPWYGFRFPANAPPQPRDKWPTAPVARQGFDQFPDGYAAVQQQITGATLLRSLFGATGKGRTIAVLDGGFTAVDASPFFAHLDTRGGIVATYDFVEGDHSVYEASGHGSAVFSTMAADAPGYYRASATDSDYLLFITEDTNGEFPMEELNWIAAAEYADSIGAHVLNASLGYTSFNDTTLNHTYRDLDGRSSIGAKGAGIAARKGMLICNSAGNSGDEPWRYIGVPADARGIISVGATDPEGKYASFSSVGPTADGRIKPDLVVPGHQVVAMSRNGLEITVGSGTSYASPILAAGLTALWSAFPEKSAEEILAAVFQSATQAERPDTLLGYGLPNFFKSYCALQGTLLPNVREGIRYAVQPIRTQQGRQSVLLFLGDILPQLEALEAVQFTDITGKEYTLRVGERPAECKALSESGILLYLNWPEWQGVAGLVKCELIFAEGDNRTTYLIFK